MIVAARRFERVNELAKSLGALGTPCDISVEAQLEALAALAITRFGRLDIAVNCAGEAIMGSIAETQEAVLRRAADIHFIGPFLFMKHMAAKMSQGGSIVTISSITATLMFPNHAAYMGAKAGTDHLVRIAAVEFGPRGNQGQFGIAGVHREPHDRRVRGSRGGTRGVREGDSARPVEYRGRRRRGGAVAEQRRGVLDRAKPARLRGKQPDAVAGDQVVGSS